MSNRTSGRYKKLEAGLQPIPQTPGPIQTTVRSNSDTSKDAMNSAAKYGASGATAGLMICGPWCAAIGGAVGAIGGGLAGYFGSKEGQRREEEMLKKEMGILQGQSDLRFKATKKQGNTTEGRGMMVRKGLKPSNNDKFLGEVEGWPDGKGGVNSEIVLKGGNPTNPNSYEILSSNCASTHEEQSQGISKGNCKIEMDDNTIVIPTQKKDGDEEYVRSLAYRAQEGDKEAMGEITNMVSKLPTQEDYNKGKAGMKARNGVGRYKTKGVPSVSATLNPYHFRKSSPKSKSTGVAPDAPGSLNPRRPYNFQKRPYREVEDTDKKIYTDEPSYKYSDKELEKIQKQIKKRDSKRDKEITSKEQKRANRQYLKDRRKQEKAKAPKTAKDSKEEREDYPWNKAGRYKRLGADMLLASARQPLKDVYKAQEGVEYPYARLDKTAIRAPKAYDYAQEQRSLEDDALRSQRALKGKGFGASTALRLQGAINARKSQGMDKISGQRLQAKQQRDAMQAKFDSQAKEATNKERILNQTVGTQNVDRKAYYQTEAAKATADTRLDLAKSLSQQASIDRGQAKEDWAVDRGAAYDNYGWMKKTRNGKRPRYKSKK